jgi:hypothetical protein
LEPTDRLKIYKRGNVAIDGIKLSNKPKKIRITYTELVKLSELRGEGMIDPYPNLTGAAWNQKMDDWKRVGEKADKQRAKKIREKMGLESDGGDENVDEGEASMPQDDIAGDENDGDQDEDEDEDEDIKDVSAAEEETVPVLEGDIDEDEGVGFGSARGEEFGLDGEEEDNEDGVGGGEDIAVAAAVGGERFNFESMVGEVRVEDDADARRLAEELANIGAYYPFGGDVWDSQEWWG